MGLKNWLEQKNVETDMIKLKRPKQPKRPKTIGAENAKMTKIIIECILLVVLLHT